MNCWISEMISYQHVEMQQILFTTAFVSNKSLGNKDISKLHMSCTG